MIEIIAPSWNDFDEVVRSAAKELLICSPFFSVEGLGHIERNLSPNLTVRFRVRLSPSDWAAGVADPEALLILIDLLRSRDCTVEIGVNQRLHAKVYAADNALLLLGSSNLTSGGFGNNVELMLRLRDEEMAVAMLPVTAALEANLRFLTFEQLGDWVTSASPAIDKARDMDRDDDATTEILVPVQSRLDEFLGYGTASEGALIEPTDADLDAFVDWLQRHSTLPGAAMLISRKVDNLQRNSGKVNQSFFGSLRFLSEHSEFVEQLVSDLAQMKPDEIYAFDDTAIAAAWAHHLDRHARDRTSYYSYPTLRGYLVPQLGGTLTGGGGGGSTFKRTLPLVAEYLRSQGR